MDEQPSVAGHVHGGLAWLTKAVNAVAIVAGIVLLIRIVLLFFGSLKTAPGYEQVVLITDYIVKPFKMATIKTPYDGVFDITATGVLMAILFIEFLLSGAETFFAKRAKKAASRLPESKPLSSPAPGPEASAPSRDTIKN